MNCRFRRTKLACYATNISMSVISNFPPLLFLTFRALYRISYSLLGLLVLVNFCTQLAVDLIFSFFSHKFNIPLTVKFTPVLSVLGLLLFAAAPVLFPANVYLGLVLGTIVFSASSGLAEVLISPVIAAIPAENPEHEMSKLHSIYAWGVVFVILVSTLFLLFLDAKYWQILSLLFALVPLTAAILFAGAKIPAMETPERVSGALTLLKNKGLWLCIAAIFLGGASECTMAQWGSGYLEQALGIPKAWGDIFGVAMFAVMLGLGRSLYAKYGKSIEKFLFWSAVGATLCYFTAAVSPFPLLGLIACGLTGFCTAMMWPGALIIGSDRFPSGGVFIYAIMAAGGDLGASVGPQLVGIITDTVAANASAASLAQTLSLTPEQLGMKLGMLVGMLFPLFAIAVFARIRHTAKKAK
ncbi:MAG: MFS transporter [Clostridia bacterium]|nr:MFS transporter [Clostridia bacterium]